MRIARLIIIAVCLAVLSEGMLASLKITAFLPRRLARPWRFNKAGFNSAGFLDRERHFKKPDNCVRVLFIGDSFLEIWGSSIVPVCEELVSSQVNKNIEFINMGESNTDPVDYYWTLKKAGIRLAPDLIIIFVTETNDFSADLKFRSIIYIAPNPRQTIFFRFFPRSAALIKLLYRKSAHFTARRNISYLKNKPWLGSEWTGLSDEAKESKLTELISKHAGVSAVRANEYVKGLSSDTKSFVFRGRYLPGYYFNHIVDAVFHERRLKRDLKAEYTAWCIMQMKKLLLQKGCNAGIKVFFIPAAEKADPDFLKAFQGLFKTKDLPFGPLLDEAEYGYFSKTLMAADIQVFNLTEALKGVRGSYTLDGHWSELGMGLVSQYVSEKLITEKGNSTLVE